MNRALHCLWRILFEPALSGVAQGCVGVRTPGKMHELAAPDSQNVQNVPTAAVFPGVHDTKMNKTSKYVE